MEDDVTPDQEAFLKFWEMANALSWLYQEPKHHRPPTTHRCTCKDSCDEVFAATKKIVNTSTSKPFQKTFGEIEASSQHGCGFCTYLHNRVSKEYERILGPEAVVELLYAHVYGHWRFIAEFGSFSISFTIDHFDTIYPNWVTKGALKQEDGVQPIDIEAKNKWDLENFTLSVRQRKFSATLQMEAEERLREPLGRLTDYQKRLAVATASQLNLARVWYFQCMDQHKECDKGRNEQFYPMRLVDVTGDVPRLIVTHTSTELSGGYATLSHRWVESDNQFGLTAEKLDSVSGFQTEIPKDQLSETFKEAIIVCKALEIPYIWIDSLCIIQNGPGMLEDWQINGSAMASIYTNCVLNIAAEVLEGTRATRGFFDSDCGVEAKTPIRFSLSDTEFVIHPVCASRNIPRPLENRGWIVQEMLLPPRILRFAIGQMSWECTQVPCACEAFPGGMRADVTMMITRELFVSPQGRDQNRLRTLREEILRLEKVQKDPNANATELSISKLQELWLNVVEAYSVCDLTFPEKDKLMAMSGISSRVGGVMKSSYIAGAFENMLPRALLWKVEKPGTWLTEAPPEQMPPAPSTKIYRSPTWSWANVDKGVDFEEYVFHARYPLLSELVSSVVHTSHGGNSYGQVAQADLIVRGNVIRVEDESLVRPKVDDQSNPSDHKVFLDNDHVLPKSGLFLLSVQCADWYDGKGKVYALILQETGQIVHGVKCAKRLGLVTLIMKKELYETEKAMIRLV